MTFTHAISHRTLDAQQSQKRFPQIRVYQRVLISLQLDELNLIAFIGIGVGLGNIRLDRRELLLRALQAGAGPQLSQDLVGRALVPGADFVRISQHNRCPHQRFRCAIRKRKPAGHDSDHGVGLPAKPHDLTQDRGIGAIDSTPDGIA